MSGQPHLGAQPQQLARDDLLDPPEAQRLADPQPVCGSVDSFAVENARSTFWGPDFEQLSATDPEIAELVAAFPAYPRG